VSIAEAGSFNITILPRLMNVGYQGFVFRIRKGDREERNKDRIFSLLGLD
jgi:hypothetical protein